MLIKKIVLIVTSLLITIAGQISAQKDCQTTPKKKKHSYDFTSPKKMQLVFVKFRNQLITALEENNLKAFHEAFKQYFNTITYPMQIKEIKFYASLFYAIFKEISDTRPLVQSFKKTKKITIFVRNQQKQYFALEVFIFSSSDGLNSNLINQQHNYGYSNTKNKKAQIIRMFHNVDNHRKLEIHALDTSEVKTFKIVKSKYFTYLDPKYISPMHQIIREFDKIQPDFKKIQTNLNTFYNTIPPRFTKPFRIKNCEKFYHALFFSIINFIRHKYVETENYACDGRMDIFLYGIVQDGHSSSTYRPIIIEFKHNAANASIALKQIEEKGYFKGISYESETINPLMVGINVTSDEENINVDPIKYKEYTKNITPLKITKLQ